MYDLQFIHNDETWYQNAFNYPSMIEAITKFAKDNYITNTDRMIPPKLAIEAHFRHKKIYVIRFTDSNALIIISKS